MHATTFSTHLLVLQITGKSDPQACMWYMFTRMHCIRCSTTLHIDAYTLSMHCVQCHMNPEVCVLIHTPCARTVFTVVQTLCSAILTHTPDACHRGDAWLQTGYNLLYGCWKYSWDADCELFLKILRGEVKEDVYVEQIQLQVLNSAAGCQIWPSLHTPVCLVTVSQQSIVPMVCYS